MAIQNALNAPLPLAIGKGGTGASLADPGADRIMFWDDSAGAVTWLTAGSGLTITGTTMTASGGGSGNIVQVVTGSTTTPVDLTSSGATYVSTGLSATITPNSTSNYLLITGNISINLHPAATGPSAGVGVKLYVAGSPLVDYVTAHYASYSTGTSVVATNRATIPFMYYYTPASTSSLTYEYYANCSLSGASTTAGISTGNELSNMTIMEIVP